MGTNIKITKQQIKEDKFTKAMLLTRDWILDNWKALALAAAAVIIIIVAVVIYTGMQSGRSEEAGSRLTQAISQFRTQNYQAAIIELGDIADKYSGDVAASALFYLAEAHYASRNYDEALANYTKYADKYHRHDLTLASALAGIAACLENKADYKAAAEKYFDTYQKYPESPNAPDYLLGAVRCHINLGDGSRVGEILDLLKKDYGTTDQYKNAVMLSMKSKS